MTRLPVLLRVQRLLLMAALLAGCTGNTVVCKCPEVEQTDQDDAGAP